MALHSMHDSCPGLVTSQQPAALSCTQAVVKQVDGAAHLGDGLFSDAAPGCTASLTARTCFAGLWDVWTHSVFSVSTTLTDDAM